MSLLTETGKSSSSVVCPVCRSSLQAVGNQSFDPLFSGIPFAQRVPCPVCGYPIDMAAGAPFPTLWTGFQIVTLGDTTVQWNTVKNAAEKKAASLGQVSSINAQADNASPASQFSVSYGLNTSAKAVGEVVGEVAKTAGNAVGQGISGVFQGLGAGYTVALIGGGIILLVLLMKE